MSYKVYGGKGRGSTRVNPSISLSGLKLYIDPLNLRSYPGEGLDIFNLIDSGNTFTTSASTIESNNNGRFKYLSYDRVKNTSGILSLTSSNCCIQLWVRNKKELSEPQYTELPTSNLLTDLVAFYDFNGNIQDSLELSNPDLIPGDSCLFNYITSVNGTSAISFANFGTCGSSSGLFYPNNVWNLYSGDNGSFSFWFKLNQNMPLSNPSLEDCGMTFFGCPFGPFGFHVALYTANNINNQIYMGFGGSAAEAHFIDPTPYNVNQWYHLAGTYNEGNGNAKFYKNGELMKDYFPPMNEPVQNFLGFGINGSGGYRAGEYGIPISMDSVGIWNRVLSREEILQLYSLTPIPETFDIINCTSNNLLSHGLYYNQTGKLGYRLKGKATTTTICLTTNKWDLITLNFESDSIKLYKNLSFVDNINNNTLFEFNNILLGNTDVDVGQILVYSRSLTNSEIHNNYKNFVSRYGIEQNDEDIRPQLMFENESTEYFERVGIVNIHDKIKINKFIYQLKINDLWDNIVAGWLLSKNYNVGEGLSAFSIKDDNNVAVFAEGANNVLPIWNTNGILFTDDGAGDDSPVEGPRMLVPNWNTPDLAAPMGITVVVAPSTSDTSNYFSCVFGKTSYGWGSELNHFGFNVDYLGNIDATFATYYVYDPAETLKRSGTYYYKLIGGTNYTMLGMTTDGVTVSTFIDNYTYPSNLYFPTTGYLWDDRIRLDGIKFSGSFSGSIQNKEYRGLISSAFVFKDRVKYELFYNIYNSIFTEYNLPLFNI